MIADAVTDPLSPFADEHRSGLARIAATLDQVDTVLFANLANLNTAMGVAHANMRRGRCGCGDVATISRLALRSGI